ncbi:hypothetical protein PsorP6_006446 [Peronosclerospora sorghi]|uniref:Uncharacterized protein n=1 Tax=Peronosclerospora sorghi TaxID=230839 RepID=A0ACC0W6V3_9STRA|nr:hypothetical protein PsorP6_006446 [Peronosclerospora sorghi]
MVMCITTHAYYLEATMDLGILTMSTYMTSWIVFFYLTFLNEISETRVWSLLATEGPAPLARDSHVAVTTKIPCRFLVAAPERQLTTFMK